MYHNIPLSVAPSQDRTDGFPEPECVAAGGSSPSDQSVRMTSHLLLALLLSSSLSWARMCWEECGDQGRVERADIIGCRQDQIYSDRTLSV